MGRVGSALLSGAILIATTACVGGGSASTSTMPPTAPTPIAPTVASVTIASATISSTSYQLSASARLSDGTTTDVTHAAHWDSADTDVAIVSPSGLVTSINGGVVDIHATYRSVIGIAHLTVARPAGPSIFTLAGVVHEVAPNARPLGGVRLSIMAGPDFGTIVTSDANGAFRFPPLARGVIAVEASRDGYSIWKIANWPLDQDRQLDISLYPDPPKNADGLTATARCNDASWSWEKASMLVCAESGVAYFVCPGPLCQTPY